MLGETPQQEAAAERRRLRRVLLHFAVPPLMVKFQSALAHKMLDRVLGGRLPSRWNPRYAEQRLAMTMWRGLVGLQRAQGVAGSLT